MAFYRWYKRKWRMCGAHLALMLWACACTQSPVPVEPLPGLPLEHKPPRLVVLIVVDQLMGQEPTMQRALWTGGIQKMLQEGRFYTRASYQHGRTETASGHATLGTGVHPRIHGIVDKRFCDPSTGKLVSACGNEKDWCDCQALKTKTLAARLKEHSPTSQVVAIAFKARSAVLSAGDAADLVVFASADGSKPLGWWHDKRTLPSWVIQTHRAGMPTPKHPSHWKAPTLPAGVTVFEDNQSGEQDLGYGTTFPYTFALDSKGKLPWAWYFSPFPDEIVRDMALAALDEVSLGRDDVVDFMVVSFPSVDTVGHIFGPNSLERLSVLQRMDQAVGAVMEKAQRVSKGRALIALSSDHGVAPTIAHARQQGHESARVEAAKVLRPVRQALARVLGFDDTIKMMAPPFLWLNIDKKDRRYAKAMAVALKVLRSQSVVYGAWATDELGQSKDPIARLLYNSAYPERSGDIAIALQPYHTFVTHDDGGDGADHGSPYEYDRNVPIFLWGVGVAPAWVESKVDVRQLTATLRDAMGVAPYEHSAQPLP